MPLNKEQLKKLSPEEQKEYSELMEGGDDNEEFGSWVAEWAHDIGVSSANDFLMDFGDEVLAGIVASYKQLQGDQNWVKNYRIAQKDFESYVEEARERSPYLTGIAGIINPSITGKMGVLKKLTTSKPVYHLLRTFVDSAVSAAGREHSGQKIDELALNIAIAGGIGSAIHGGFKTLGSVAKMFSAKSKVAASVMGVHVNHLKKFVNKYRNRNKTAEEASRDLLNKTFNNKLLTEANVDYDTETGNFLSKKGMRIKMPNISDVQRNMTTALKQLGEKLNELLPKAKLKKDLNEAIIEIGRDTRKHMLKEYGGRRLGEAERAFDDFYKTLYHAVKQVGKRNPILTLDRVKKQLDKKLSKLFGNKDAAFEVSDDIDMFITARIRKFFDDNVEDPEIRKKLTHYYDQIADFKELEGAVRNKGISTAVSSEVQDFYPSDPGIIKGTFLLAREKLGRHLHKVGEVESAASDAILPGILKPSSYPVPFLGRKNQLKELGGKASIESVAELPTRVGQTMAPFFSGAGDERETDEYETLERNPESMQQPAEIPQGMVPGDVEQQIPMETPMPMERPPIDPRQQRMEMLKQKKQQDALDLLQRSKLPRDSAKFIENRQLVMAKIAHESPGDINRISHVLNYEPDKIEDLMTVLSIQAPQLFENDSYKRINKKITDNNAKARARKDTMNREDITTIQKSEIIDRINKTGEFTADIENAVAKEPQQTIQDIYPKLSRDNVIPIKKPGIPPPPPQELPPAAMEEDPLGPTQMRYIPPEYASRENF